VTARSADYQKGYAAGRRRADRDERDTERQHAVMLARYALASAIAPEVIRSPWHKTVNGVRKPQNTAAGMAEVIAELVRHIERRL